MVEGGMEGEREGMRGHRGKNICIAIGQTVKYAARARLQPEGGSGAKVYSGMCCWNGLQNQPPGITMTPYSVQKLI